MDCPALPEGRGNGAKNGGRKKWCERRGLNSQGLLRWILNPVRMPVSPLSHERAIYCKAMNLTQLRAGGKRKSVVPEERNATLSRPKREMPHGRRAGRQPHGYPAEARPARASPSALVLRPRRRGMPAPGMQTNAGEKARRRMFRRALQEGGYAYAA